MQQLEKLKKQIDSSPFFTEPKYERYRLLLVPFIVFVIALLVSVLVTIPQVYKLAETFKTIDELNEKKSFYQTKALELESIKVEDYRRDLDTALVALPVEKDIPGVMSEILVSLGGSGLRLNGITFSNAPPESEKVEEFNINIDASGSQASLLNFLERVTITPRLIKLTSIDVDAVSQGNINTSLSFTTFYQTLPTNIGSLDTPLPKIGNEETQILADIETKKQRFPTPPEASGSSQGKLDPFRP